MRMYTTTVVAIAFLAGYANFSQEHEGLQEAERTLRQKITDPYSFTTVFTSAFSTLKSANIQSPRTAHLSVMNVVESIPDKSTVFVHSQPSTSEINPRFQYSGHNMISNASSMLANTPASWKITSGFSRQEDSENSTILPAIAVDKNTASYPVLTPSDLNNRTSVTVSSTKRKRETSNTLKPDEAQESVLYEVKPRLWRVNLSECARYTSGNDTADTAQDWYNHTACDGDLEILHVIRKGISDSSKCFLQLDVNSYYAGVKCRNKDYITMVVRNFSLTADNGECVNNVSYVTFSYSDMNRYNHETDPCVSPFAVTFDSMSHMYLTNYVDLIVHVNPNRLIINSDLFLSLKLTFHQASKRIHATFSQTETASAVGYQSNFLFDGQLLYSRFLYHGFVIRISSQVLMTSFTHFHLNCHGAFLALARRKSLSEHPLGLSPAYFVDIYQKTNRTIVYVLPGNKPQLIKITDFVWKRCGMWNEVPHIFNDSVLMVYNSEAAQPYTGFRMLYSIHNVTQAPTQLDSGLFNCSVAYYHTFQQHLQCNLEVQCQDGEDERDCPYTTDACGPGNIDAGNKCYTFFRVNTDTSWFDANDYCVERGMKLISPQTPQEFNKFKEILKFTMNSSQFFVGLRTSDLNAMYAEVWQWTDGTSAFYNMIDNFDRLSKPQCAYVKPLNRDGLHAIPCGTLMRSHNNGFMHVLCETTKDNLSSSQNQLLSPIHGNFTYGDEIDGLVRCSDGHYVKDFLSCDLLSQCGVKSHKTSCQIKASGFVYMFLCDDTTETLPYTLVCNHRRDCADGSDESFCVHPKCLEKQCKNKQCVTYDQWCDGMQHCVDGSDEICRQYVTGRSLILPPAIVNFNRHVGYTLSPMAPNDTCPVTHLRCSGGFCIPVYLRCNGVYDCLGHEDETGCDGYQCPGLYRCRASSVCVHTNHVCDGVFQCPQQDDELLCNLTCPEGCGCQGSAFVCTKPFPAASHPDLRYLDASGSGMTPDDLATNFYLVSVTLSRCGLKHLSSMAFRNLRTLDLSANNLSYINIHVFKGCVNLRELRLSRNPINILKEDGLQTVFQHVHSLDLSETDMTYYSSEMLSNFPFLRALNISHTGIRYATNKGFNSTPNIEVLDARGSPLDDFPHIIRHLTSLEAIYASNYKLCCPAVLPPHFNPKSCHAPKDDIASCDDLLRSNTYRVCLWIMALLAVTGNIGSLVTRLYIQRKSSPSSFSVFVTNLNVADTVMGVYLGIVGTADQVFRGVYLWQDNVWRKSAVCKIAGFLSLLSSEVSAFLICFITLDSLFALSIMFSGLRFSAKSAAMVCGIAWTVAASLSIVPVLPLTSHWEFYGQNGICLPLPVIGKAFEGRPYSFAIMIVLNMTLSFLTAVGQLLIYFSVQKTSISISAKDANIARRLITVVLSDSLCWFPIGLLGLLASAGMSVSNDVNVAMAIIVVPFNSALNPCLYTFNVAMEKRRKATEARMLVQLAKRLESQRRVRHVGTMTSEVDHAAEH